MKQIASILLLAGLWLTLQSSSPDAEGEPECLRVMSYNIRLGVADDGTNSWPNRREATGAMLDCVQPDIFGVQEAYDFQVRYITLNCPRYRCVGVGREDGLSAGEHMSVFYDTASIQLLAWGNYWLSETPDVPSLGWDARCKRTATWTHLRHIPSGCTFYYVNTHLDHIGVIARQRGLMLIYDSIRAMNPDGEPMILTGDFNVLPDNDNLKVLDGLMLSARATAEDRDTIGSFNGFGLYARSAAAPTLGAGINPDDLKALDYIYYHSMGRCERFCVDTTMYIGIPFISDHYPVWADFNLSDEE